MGKRDPIKKLAQEIIDGKFATEEELKSIEKKIDTEGILWQIQMN